MRFVDLTGKRFGRLTVLQRADGKEKRSYFLCKCDCGNVLKIVGRDIKRGHTVSCGCYKKEIIKQRNTVLFRIDGRTNTRLYKVWVSMKMRCENQNHKAYNDYGGRGITICEEWSKFENFKKWAIESGYNENCSVRELTLDRIDVNGNYEPNNCRWVDMKTQANNRRNNVFICINGENRTVSEWARYSNINLSTLWYRIKRGWTGEKLIEKPVKNKGNGSI